jgi:hypothetical protein
MTTPYAFFVLAALIVSPALFFDLEEQTNGLLAIGGFVAAYLGVERFVERKANSYNKQL